MDQGLQQGVTLRTFIMLTSRNVGKCDSIIIIRPVCHHLYLRADLFAIFVFFTVTLVALNRFPATNVDFGATFLALGGLDKPDTMDGKSFLSLIVNSTAANLPASVQRSLARSPADEVAAGWRDTVFITHYRVGAGSVG